MMQHDEYAALRRAARSPWYFLRRFVKTLDPKRGVLDFPDPAASRTVPIRKLMPSAVPGTDAPKPQSEKINWEGYTKWSQMARTFLKFTRYCISVITGSQ